VGSVGRSSVTVAQAKANCGAKTINPKMQDAPPTIRDDPAKATQSK